MLWEEYLVAKKIDSDKFKKNESELWGSWKLLFEQIHPKSFTAQKLYLINSIRRKYFLEEPELPKKEPVKKPIMKPKLNEAKPKAARPKMAKLKPVFKKPKTD
ncbi:MAG: hypothetical protein AAGA02_09190 [Bacteroidota bacterium]